MIEVGTVSHGTLRTVDLLRAFGTELQRVNPDGPWRADIQRAAARVAAIEAGADETDADSELVSELQDALDAAAPAGMYFGTLEGDASEFGWWHNEDGRRAALAQEFADAFERRQRANGDSFLVLKDGAPEWMMDAIRAAHDGGDMLPNDWSYRLAAAVVDDIAERLRDDPAADLQDISFEVVDTVAAGCDGEESHWLASHRYRFAFCDDALKDGLVSPAAELRDRIGAGVRYELGMICSAIIGALVTESE